MTSPAVEQVRAALSKVNDPEIHKPITELGMVDAINISDGGQVDIRVLLTVVGCPMRDRLTNDVTAAVSALPGVTGVSVAFGVMDDAQRAALQTSLRGGQVSRDIPFNRPDSLTKVFAIASGKGGVGKSSVTVNLAVAMARSGLKVGIVDADLYWSDLDVLLLDLPPGTGDMAISLGQHLPNAEVVVVTTPQEAAAEVAERAGTMASMMHQRVVGVVENMSYLACPHCGPSHQLDVFGTGGGQRVADTLASRFGYDVPLLAKIPLEPSLREGGDAGKPVVESDPTNAAAVALREVAGRLVGRGRGLAGLQLGLTPTGRF